ncbi:hypothetical protein [Rufibacter aurantiacus]|uniref:hypothetical protein n=1 Tax=Rufibacter aurantiacus TaxID=2817374 RepID=UPI001B3023E5|nr:hypothetical protein [Rufibacter aurantiacus]
MHERLKVFIKYGALCFAASFLLLYVIPLAMLLVPLAFNLILWIRLREQETKKQYLHLAIGTGIFTTAVFFIQLLYREQGGWACTQRISDLQANASYASTMILFSLLSWGYGTSFIEKKKQLYSTNPKN